MSLTIIANFKSNKTSKEVNKWISQVDTRPAAKLNRVLLAPAFTSFPTDIPSNLELAGQDVSPFPPGAYTGAVNAKQLESLGVTLCLVGHSERRRYFHETDQEVANKIDNLLEAGITPVVCLDDQYINSQLSLLSDEIRNNCLFAFEPAQDIGGKVAAPNDLIQGVFSRIQAIIGTDKNIIYGGSVNVNNVSELVKLKNLSGFIVSTASLNANSFIELLKTTSNG